MQDVVNILAVDDVAANLIAIEHILDGLPINLVKANGGYEALEQTFHYDFGLVLLDVQMPEIDGYQTAQMMRSASHCQHTPIIFLTANSLEESNILKGYESGAIDYITKPVNSTILRSKIKIFYDMHVQKMQLKAFNENMEQLVKERTSQLQSAQHKLVEQETMARLGGLVAGVAHEVNTPLGVSVTAVSFVQDILTNHRESLSQDTLSKDKTEALLESLHQSIDLIHANLQRAADLIMNFKQIAVDQSHDQAREFDIRNYASSVIKSLNPSYKASNHRFIVVDADQPLLVDTYPGAISQIITNFLTNSLLHGFDTDMHGEGVFAFTKDTTGTISFTYTDNGKGMSADTIKHVFDPFFTTKRGQGGSGLGMHIAYNLVTQTLGGQIDCRSTLGQGVRFEIRFPVGSNTTVTTYKEIA